MNIKGKTIFFDKPPVIVGSAGVVGKKEGEGPLADDFDAVYEDTTMGEDSYELSESAMLNSALTMALKNANTQLKTLILFFAAICLIRALRVRSLLKI